MTKYLPPGPDREQAAAQIREQEQGFNLWLIEQERRRMHDLPVKFLCTCGLQIPSGPVARWSLTRGGLSLIKPLPPAGSYRTNCSMWPKPSRQISTNTRALCLRSTSWWLHQEPAKSDAKRFKQRYRPLQVRKINTLGQPLYVVSAANFANVNSNGNANCNDASNANGVRPVVGPLDFTTAHDG